MKGYSMADTLGDLHEIAPLTSFTPSPSHLSGMSTAEKAISQKYRTVVILPEERYGHGGRCGRSRGQGPESRGRGIGDGSPVPSMLRVGRRPCSSEN